MVGFPKSGHKYISHYVVLSDPPYTTAYNVTISSSLTPADLSGFDIMISWTVSDDSVMGHYIRIHTLFSVCSNSLSTRS